MKTISPVYIRVFGTQRFSAQGKSSAFLGLVCRLHTTARTSSPPSHWRRPHLDQPCAKTAAACDVATKPRTLPPTAASVTIFCASLNSHSNTGNRGQDCPHNKVTCKPRFLKLYTDGNKLLVLRRYTTVHDFARQQALETPSPVRDRGVGNLW